jgi:hypothetical protein
MYYTSSLHILDNLASYAQIENFAINLGNTRGEEKEEQKEEDQTDTEETIDDENKDDEKKEEVEAKNEIHKNLYTSTLDMLKNLQIYMDDKNKESFAIDKTPEVEKAKLDDMKQDLQKLQAEIQAKESQNNVDSMSTLKWVFIGIGVTIGLIILGFIIYYIYIFFSTPYESDTSSPNVSHETQNLPEVLSNPTYVTSPLNTTFSDTYKNEDYEKEAKHTTQNDEYETYDNNNVDTQDQQDNNTKSQDQYETYDNNNIDTQDQYETYDNNNIDTQDKYETYEDNNVEENTTEGKKYGGIINHKKNSHKIENGNKNRINN